MRSTARAIPLALFFAAPLAAAPEPVSLDALRAHLDFLASDALEGRFTGSRGYEIAALYSAAQFRQWGLAPGAGDSFLQPVPLVEMTRESSSIDRLGEGGHVPSDPSDPIMALAWKADYILSNRAGHPDVALDAPVVFAGFGIDADKAGRHDYQGVDVRGAVVVLLSGSPPGLPSEIRAHFASSRQKRIEAARRGAIGVLTLKTRDDERRSPWERSILNADRPAMALRDSTDAVVDDAPGLLFTGAISREGAGKLLAGSGVRVDQLLDLGDSAAGGSRSLGTRVRVVARSTERVFSSPNVVALLPGSDPARSNELVVVSAHLDHLGIGAEVEGDTVYNGFYDNAMGSAMVLEVARRLARAEPRPRRSIAFLLVTGEERGLLGSEHFAQNPSVPGATLAADINVDMPLFLHPVADVVAFGAEHSTLGALARAAVEAQGFAVTADPEPEESIFVRSDQYSFVRRGVPSIYLDTGFGSRDGTDAGRAATARFRDLHYHRPSDEAELGADWDGVVRFDAAVTELARAVADSPEPPRWLPGSFFGELFGAAQMTEAMRPAGANGDLEFHADALPDDRPGISVRTVLSILATGACYYLATRVAWVLCFPDSKVSLFFPPHAVLVSILLLVPTRHWWAYTLAAAGSHYFATQQAHWPPLYALHCEAFDAVQNVLTALGVRTFVKSRFDLISLREAMNFVLIAVIAVPVGTAFWGAAFTVSNHFGTNYWIEWRNLSISNGVTAIVLIPALLIGAQRLTARRFDATPARRLEAGCLALGLLALGWVAFDRSAAGPDSSAALLYAPVPLLIWAALRFGLGGVSAAMLAVTSQAIWGTMQGRGPFLTQSPSENALALQLFLLMAATPLMLLTVAIDDERRSKEALRVSEARMSLAVESAQLALWDWDVESDRLWLTDDGRKFFGFEPGEPVRFADLSGRVHPDDGAKRGEAIGHALESGGSYESEYRIVLPDGSVRWVAARGRSRGPAHTDEPRRILGVSMDITRQKVAAAEVRQQREELAHLSRVAALSALSGSLAHELGQPLASILSNARAGQRFMSQDVPDLVEIQDILEDIANAVLRADEIIERLRTMLRRGEVALQPVSVNECVDELLRLTRSDLIARGVSVTNFAAGDLPPAMTDRVQLQQVLLNLIVNACDAMASDPPKDRILTLTASTSDDEVRIGVLDRGVGLPDEVEALFQPFHTTKDGGLGMGLSICRTLVASHGGRLWAERRAERGAAFYVALPLARKQDSIADPATPNRSA